MKYIQTVTGIKSVEELGRTTTHEHIFLRHGRYTEVEAAKPGNEWMSEKVSLENRGKLMYNLHLNKDNPVLDDDELMAREVAEFKKYGGNTIVDVSCYGIGGNVQRIKEFSEKTGVNIIVPTGTYTLEYMPQHFKEMSEDELTELFIRDVTEGIGDTDIKAGCIGEMGGDYFKEEPKFVRAAGRAQKETGAAVVFHSCGIGHLKELDSIGADLSKVIVGHRDAWWNDITSLKEFLNTGANIAFDTFGLTAVLSYTTQLPSDADRMTAIRNLFDAGYENKIVIGHDICFKVQLKKYGGFGYSHFFENVSRVALNNNFTQKDIDILTIHNPARIFGFEK